jgi:hypothetical protein
VERADVDPVIEFYKKDVDRTLLRNALKLTPEERLRELMRLQAEALGKDNASNATPTAGRG